MAEKRSLVFSDWGDVLNELDQLSGCEYEQAGQWNLGECCNHLNDWLGYPMDGFPKSPFPAGAMLWMMKVVIGKSMLNSIIKNGFKPGTPTAPHTVHSVDKSSDHDAVQNLKQTVQRFQDFQGEIHSSPFFGSMDKPTAEKLQLQHFSHHLSYLIPKV